MQSSVKLGFSDIPLRSLSSENFVAEICKADLIINATPVGMYHYGVTRLYASSLLDTIDNIKEKFFFDAVLNPFLTYFLLDAQEHGAKVCSGLYMMIYQIIIVFSLWTGRSDVEKRINIEESKTIY